MATPREDAAAFSRPSQDGIAPASSEKLRTPTPSRVPRTGFLTHTEYFEAQSPEVRPLLEWIQQTTESLIPGATRCVSYGMPAFRKGKIFLYFAAFKEHVGIYPPLRADVDLIRELAPYRGPKGNLSFPFSRPFPKALAKRIVRALAAEYGDAAPPSKTPRSPGRRRT